MKSSFSKEPSFPNPIPDFRIKCRTNIYSIFLLDEFQFFLPHKSLRLLSWMKKPVSASGQLYVCASKTLSVKHLTHPKQFQKRFFVRLAGYEMKLLSFLLIRYVKKKFHATYLKSKHSRCDPFSIIQFNALFI